jgi:hypothetical protein
VDNDCFGITAIPFCMASAIRVAGPMDFAPTILQPRIRNMHSGQNEAFSRILIDKALEFSGWDLLNPLFVIASCPQGLSYGQHDSREAYDARSDI